MTTKTAEDRESPAETLGTEEGLRPETVDFSGDIVTQRKKEIFLDTYREVGTILGSYKAAGVSRKTIYIWLEADPAFKVELDEAKEDFADYLENLLYERGKSAGQNRTNIELLAALKAARREKWGDNITVTPQEGVITFRVVRIEVVDYVKPEALEAPKQLREPVIDITCGEDN